MSEEYTPEQELIARQVRKVVTNCSNWPSTVGAEMLGRDLSVPINKIIGALLPVVKQLKAEAWEEGAKVAYDLASDDIGAWEVLHEFPEEFPEEAVNPYD